MQLTKYRASRYFARLPPVCRRSRFTCVMSILLPMASRPLHVFAAPSALQTPSLANGALANRIVFPLVGVTSSSFRRPGLGASPGKQKTGGPDQGHLQLLNTTKQLQRQSDRRRMTAPNPTRSRPMPNNAITFGSATVVGGSLSSGGSGGEIPGENVAPP